MSCRRDMYRLISHQRIAVGDYRNLSMRASFLAKKRIFSSLNCKI